MEIQYQMPCIACTDFYYSKQEINGDKIINWLITDRPILICVVNKQNSRWTKASHYMVLLGYDENKVYISNPNQTNSGKKDSSGWYNIEEILPYIVKAVFIKKD